MWPTTPGLSSILPPEMEGRLASPSSGADIGLSDLDDDKPPPLPARPRQNHTSERPPTNSLRPPFRANLNVQSTIRAVTPEPADGAHDALDTNTGSLPPAARAFGSRSPQSSPRSISVTGSNGYGNGGGVGLAVSTGNNNRRQGMVFNDAFASSFDSTSSSPPPRPSPFRPRTHTMDGAVRHQATPSFENRHRVGSFSSSGSLPVTEDLRAPQLQPPPLESASYPSSTASPSRPPDLQIPTAASLRERKSNSRRLIKRTSSRPTSPLISPPPSVDSLPLPIPTDDANKVLLLMKTLCGRMRGKVEYQCEPGETWRTGICYIDEEKGSLMFDSGENGPFHVRLVQDLRGCRILPVERPAKDAACLEIVNSQIGLELMLRPLVADEFDLWLAALLCWQQLRPPVVRAANGRSTGPPTPARPEMRRRGSAAGLRDPAIIKVGKVMLWDKGLATSPRAIVKRSSTRDLRSSTTSWRRVSCILQDNGEFKLLTENDVTVLSVIELSQLSRSAIQQLDRSVLDEEYCIAIFPIYASTATQLSIFRPVYIALDSRVLFEVWFVLLRAFAMPSLYGLFSSGGDQLFEVTDLNAENPDQLFRVERTINLRITEAKVRRNPPTDATVHDRQGKGEQDPSVGNYLAEVVLDGEVRARTTTKTETRNPFWREDCEFVDIPSTTPYLSVVLRKVEGNLDSLNQQVQASLGLPKTGNLPEVACGAVDIPLDQLERGKDHEQWLPIYDEKQQSIGTMLIKVHHEEFAVLSAKEYQAISELLHRFGSGLTAQISEAIPGGLRRVAEILLNIFQVSGSATEWLMNLVEDEIDGIGNQTQMKSMRFSRRLRSSESVDSASDREQLVRDMGKSLAGEANLLFRGNSLLTQSLEFYMRRLGKEYLEEVLSDKIFEINEINPNCEVDPGKLQQGDDIQQHWNQLIHLTTEIWDCIASSAPRLPPELRHILKYIRAVAEDRYGDFLRTVTYTSVSGFFFLRFICPAILNPKLFGLLRDHPRPRAQRTLTLVAKGLQALANLSTIGKKETWMEPMNRFLNSHRQSLKDFLDRLCAIPVERATLVLPASYSTPITILGRLSPTAREGFPSLPYLIDHARNFAALVKLWTDSHPPGRQESLLFDGDLLLFNDACTALQRRAGDCFARVEALRAAEYASLPPEDLSDAFEHASVLESASPPYGGGSPSAPWMTDHDLQGNQTLRPPGSSGSEMDGGVSFFSGGRPERERPGKGDGTPPTTTPTSINVGYTPRWASGGTELTTGSGILVRPLPNPRKILSGFMRKGRTASPDAAASSGAGAGQTRSSPSTIRERAREVQRNIAAAEAAWQAQHGHGHGHGQGQGSASERADGGAKQGQQEHHE